MGKSLNGKELGRGIVQRRDGLYQGSFTSRLGKRKTIYAKTLTEIRRKLRDAQYEDENGVTNIRSDMTLDAWFDIWIVTLKSHCRDTSTRSYRMIYNNHIRPYIGNRKLNDINTVVIQDALQKIESEYLQKRTKSLLVDIFERAIEAELITKNPSRFIKFAPSTAKTAEKEVFSEEDERKLNNVMGDDCTFYYVFHVALGTGMRIGELLGLQWGDVDFDNNVIHVRRTLVMTPNNGATKYSFHPPKSNAGNRTIPMTKVVKNTLLKQQERKRNIERRYQSQNEFSDLVFVSRTNRPLRESNMLHALNSYEEKAGVRKLTLHSLRHTFATRCIARGMNPKVLQKILGHERIEITMNTYCHVEDDTILTEMALFDELA